jgi:hypothetical protein
MSHEQAQVLSDQTRSWVTQGFGDLRKHGRDIKVGWALDAVRLKGFGARSHGVGQDLLVDFLGGDLVLFEARVALCVAAGRTTQHVVNMACVGNSDAAC